MNPNTNKPKKKYKKPKHIEKDNKKPNSINLNKPSKPVHMDLSDIHSDANTHNAFIDNAGFGYGRQTGRNGMPSEDEVINTIMNCVKLDRTEILLFRENFSNEQSGLYDALIKLFSRR